MTLVTAMEERVEEVHLGSWGTATIHLPTLATYSGRGRCACAVFNEILGLVVFTIFGEGTLSTAPVFTGSHSFCSANCFELKTDHFQLIRITSNNIYKIKKI